MSKQFIKIGNERVKCSNIKNYGTSSRKVVEVLEIEHEANGFFENAVDMAAMIIGIHSDANEARSVYGGVEKKKITKIIKYLYITTYQNDNLTWDEGEINLNKVLSELDSM